MHTEEQKPYLISLITYFVTDHLTKTKTTTTTTKYTESASKSKF
jgi:phenylpyruvate tautomerase PptA (4-oxalocrotonate tautomerase family)